MVSRKSIVLSAAFPESKTGFAGFAAAIEAIEPYGFAAVEYYIEDAAPEGVRSILDGRAGIFLGGAKQKRDGLSLCTLNEAQRLHAVEEMRECVRFAKAAGSEAVLFTSGERPAREEDDAICLDELRDSLLRISEAAPDMLLLLEPGDRDVQYRQLIGTTASAAEFARSLSGKVPFGLTFDISHAAQTGEDVYTAWKLARECSSHVHLANCVLREGSPLYGDRHPFFGVENGVYSQEDAEAFYRFLCEDIKELTVGIEMIRREDEPDGFFGRLRRNVHWFF